jgi:hypothetical protein
MSRRRRPAEPERFNENGGLSQAAAENEIVGRFVPIEQAQQDDGPNLEQMMAQVETDATRFFDSDEESDGDTDEPERFNEVGWLSRAPVENEIVGRFVPIGREQRDDGPTLEELLANSNDLPVEYNWDEELEKEYGVPVESVDDLAKKYPLFGAVWLSKEQTVKNLLKKGANANQESNTGSTPLFFAKTYEIANILLAFGATYDHQDIFGNTALHYAIIDDNLGVVQALLRKHELEPRSRRKDEYLLTKNKQGETPLDIAFQLDRPEIAQRLIAHLYATRTCMFSPAHMAMLSPEKRLAILTLVELAGIRENPNNSISLLPTEMLFYLLKQIAYFDQ